MSRVLPMSTTKICSQILIRGDGGLKTPREDYTDGTTDITGGVMLDQVYLRPSRLQTPTTNYTTGSNGLYRQARTYSSNGYTLGRRPSNGRDSHDDTSFPSDVDKEDQYLPVPSSEKQFYARNEQRTLLIKNLSDRVAHKDIVDVVRGGALLDVYLRSNDRSASVSFLEGAAAQAFLAYAKRNDIYIHGKRVSSTLFRLPSKC